MALPISVTYTFATATSAIPLSQLDSNFTTVVNGINGIGNGTNSLSNVSITGGAIDGATIGATTSSTGRFSTITATTGNIVTVNATTLNAATHRSDTSLTFQTNGTTTAMTIDTSQNVGVGITSPGTYSKFVVSGGNGNFISYIGSSTQSILGDNGGTAGQTGTVSNHPFLFLTNATERMRIDSSGNVGIGTSSMATKLDVIGTNDIIRAWDGTNGQLLLGTNSSGPYIFTPGANALRFGTNNAEVARFDSSGNLLVGTTAATAGSRFSVKGGFNTSSGWNIYTTDSAGVTQFAILGDGAFYTGGASKSPYNYTTASSANVFISSDNGLLLRSTSSLRYKTDVKDATHGLKEVMKLRSVTYKGKNDGDTVFGGLIAEEVDAIGLTEFVQYAEDGTPDALAYGNMVSLLVKAIQELKAEIDLLKGAK